MFEKLFRRFKKQEPLETSNEQPILFCVHGFGRRTKHEFDNLVSWGNQDGYQVITFNMYDLFDENDCNWMMWIDRAKEQLEEVRKHHKRIIIVGFSMGGVIASYLATLYTPEKLILLAPAFAYISPDTFAQQINIKAKQLFQPKEEDYDVHLPKSFYAAFVEVVKHLRKYISKVTCPVLLLHGDQDEIISVKSSYYAYESIPHEQKRLYIIHGGTHRLLKESPLNNDTYQFIKLFLQDQLVTIPYRESCPDILKDLYEEKQRRIQNPSL